MSNKKEIIAGVIIIGNEVLSGRTKDINTSSLATWPVSYTHLTLPTTPYV